MSSVEARVVKHLAAVKDTPPFDLNVAFRADDGICLILGPSGSGKTLLLNSIGGFLRPDDGRVLVNDQIYFDAVSKVHLAPHLRRCGYIFQDHALFPHMTVRGNLQFAASMPFLRASRRNMHKRIQEMLQIFDLGELAERKPAQLSGGQKQRAALARILVTEPRVLLLDEPSRGLDALLRHSFYDLLRNLRERLRIPILLVSHDVDECFELADSVCVMAAGQILQAGSRETVFAKPATVEIARLLGIYNIAPAVIRSLDPAANKSRLQIFDQEIEGRYFPGHLIGDTGYACLLRSEMRVSDRETGNCLVFGVEGRYVTQNGIRLQLEHGFSIGVRASEYEAMGEPRQVAIEVPAPAVTFTGR